MKKIIGAILLLSLSSIAEAENWVATLDKFLVDTDNILRKDSQVFFWDRRPADENQFNAKFIDKYNKADCDVFSFQIVQSRLIDTTGKTIVSDNSQTNIDYYPPDSIGAGLIKFACKAYYDSQYWSPEKIKSVSEQIPPSLIEAKTKVIKDGDKPVTYVVNINSRLSLTITDDNARKERTCIVLIHDLPVDHPINLLFLTDFLDTSSTSMSLPSGMYAEGYVKIRSATDSHSWPPEKFHGYKGEDWWIDSVAKKLYSDPSTEIEIYLAPYNDEWLGALPPRQTRASSVGFNLLWDKAVEECNFPKLAPAKSNKLPNISKPGKSKSTQISNKTYS